MPLPTNQPLRRRRSDSDEPSGAPQPPAKLMRHSASPDEGEGLEMAKTQNASSSEFKARRHARVPHNLIERRYRDNLNSQIEVLRLAVPALRDAYDCATQDVDENGLVMPSKLPSKAVIIAKAAKYIKDLEAEKTKLAAKSGALQEQVVGLQKLVRCNDCSILQYRTPLQFNQHPSAHSHEIH